jgi:hypothetical protein
MHSVEKGCKTGDMTKIAYVAKQRLLDDQARRIIEIGSQPQG